MSLRALDAVFRSTLPATDKVAMLALADWADDDGRRIFPSMRTAAAKASLSDRTMQRVVQRHVVSGLLEVVTEATPRMPAEYRLRIDRLPGVRGDSVSPPAVESGVTATPLGVSGSHPRGDSDDTRGDTQSVRGDTLSPNPLVTVSKKQPSKERASRASRLPDLFPLTDELRNYAVGKGCTNPERTHEAFTTHYRGNGKAQLDWVATFRTWVLGAHGGPDWKACGCQPRAFPGQPAPGSGQAALDAKRAASDLRVAEDQKRYAENLRRLEAAR